MGQRRDLREQLGRHRLAGNEQVDRLETSLERGVDEILALGDEQPELVAPAPGVKLADELQRLVVGRRDQSRRATCRIASIVFVTGRGPIRRRIRWYSSRR